MERNRKMIETDLFEFAYVPDWYGQLEQLAEMALPSPDKLRMRDIYLKGVRARVLRSVSERRRIQTTG